MAAGRMQRQAVLLPPRGHSQGSTAAAHLRVLILSVAREALQHRGPEGGHPAPLARHIQHGGGLQGGAQVGRHGRLVGSQARRGGNPLPPCTCKNASPLNILCTV